MQDAPTEEPVQVADGTAVSPYSKLPSTHFWKTGVCEQNPRTVEGIYTKKFAIGPEAPIAAAGSCFAQHVSKRLREQGFNVMDVEPPPATMGHELANRFGYGIYSARYGNIYHVRHLLQLAYEAFGYIQPVDGIWTRGQRFFDAFRPSVEPEGLGSADEVRAHRSQHLGCVARLFSSMEVFIFTLGLTEAWVHREGGTVYPTAPGTMAGTYDPRRYKFKNFSYSEIRADLERFRALILCKNPNAKFLLTVSPVPLTATASGHHVLAATTYSKSVLRAVAGDVASKYADVDYFPSYELIATPFSRGEFFKSNLRSVEEAGVDAVMRAFFSAHAPPLQSAEKAVPSRKPTNSAAAQAEQSQDVVCDDVLLEAFAK